MKNEPTISEVLESVNGLSTNIDERFEGIDKRFDAVDKRFDGIDKRFERMETRLTKIEATMVTKDYLDDKLADLRGDLVVLMRKEDRKVAALVEVLLTRKVISNEDAKTILAMELFPQIAR